MIIFMKMSLKLFFFYFVVVVVVRIIALCHRFKQCKACEKDKRKICAYSLTSNKSVRFLYQKGGKLENDKSYTYKNSSIHTFLQPL